MLDKVHADVLSSFLDYRVAYREPVFDFLRLYGQISQSVFRAFREWNVTIENISSKQNPNSLSDISTTFTLPGGRIAFSVGLGMSNLFVSNPNWSEAGMIAKVAQAGVTAVVGATGAIVDQQKASIAMHLRPTAGSIKDAVSNLLRLSADELQTEDVRAYGVSIYRKDSTWIVDASATYQDALFMRIDRIWDSQMPLDEGAAQLQADETRVLDLLRLEVD